MKVCVVGYGMVGEWHSRAVRDMGAELHTLVGRPPLASGPSVLPARRVQAVQDDWDARFGVRSIPGRPFPG